MLAAKMDLISIKKIFQKKFYAAIYDVMVKALFCFFLGVSEAWLQKTLGPMGC